MTQIDLHALIRATLIDMLGEEAGRAAAESDEMVAEGYLDSFGMMDLSARLEVELNIVLPLEALTPVSFRSVDRIAELCERQLKP